MGVIAYEYAKKYPEHVSHLVMIGSPSTYATAEYQDAVDTYWETAPPERKALFEEKQQQLSGALDQKISSRMSIIQAGNEILKYIAKKLTYLGVRELKAIIQQHDQRANPDAVLYPGRNRFGKLSNLQTLAIWTDAAL